MAHVMPLPSGPESSAGTRERILDASELLFADAGFDGTSVRDITAAAGVNLAAMNYHFGGKDSLYQEVVLRRLSLMRDERVAAIRRAMHAGRPRPRLEDVVRAFGVAVLAPILDWDRGRVVVQLMAREMSEPRLPKGTCQIQVMQPVEAELAAAIREIVPALDGEAARMAVHGVHSQLLGLFQVARCQGTLERRSAYGVTFAKALDYIVRFSAAGIRGLAGGSRP